MRKSGSGTEVHEKGAVQCSRPVLSVLRSWRVWVKKSETALPRNSVRVFSYGTQFNRTFVVLRVCIGGDGLPTEYWVHGWVHDEEVEALTTDWEDEGVGSNVEDAGLGKRFCFACGQKL